MSDTMVIQGHQFKIDSPYKAGHQITEIEAGVLNQTRKENIRNNFAKSVKEAENDKNELTPKKHEELQNKLDEYAAAYEFNLAGGRAGDPIEREARILARAAITAQIKKAGKAIKDIDSAALTAKVNEIASTNKEIIAMAKKNVESRKAAESVSIEGL